MSHKKQLHILSELSVHPISRNIEWSDLIPALSSIGLLQSESNGNYDFTRNGHKIVFEQAHGKTLDIAEVLKLRRFLKLSALTIDEDATVHNTEIVAIDHHKATVIHNPGLKDEYIEKFHADLTDGRILHKTKHSPNFNDQNPSDDSEYFDATIKTMMKSHKIVLLSHGTGSSNAAERLFAVIQQKYPAIAKKIVAIKRCDLEAMTEPEMVTAGIELLHLAPDQID